MRKDKFTHKNGLIITISNTPIQRNMELFSAPYNGVVSKSQKLELFDVFSRKKCELRPPPFFEIELSTLKGGNEKEKKKILPFLFLFLFLREVVVLLLRG